MDWSETMGDFDWKIWITKGVYKLAYTLLATGLIAFADYINVTEFPAEYVFWAGIGYTVLLQLGNAIKHKYLV
jgi:hypothetical protein